MSFNIVKRFIEKEMEKEKIPSSHIIYLRGGGQTVLELLRDILRHLNLPLPSKRASFGEHFSILERSLQKCEGGVHVCIDEVDRLGERGVHDVDTLLYYFSRTRGLSCTLITNDVMFISKIKDARTKSSLTKDKSIIFERYNAEQCYNIFSERCKLAFQEGGVEEEALRYLSDTIGFETGSVRDGLDMLRLAVGLAIKREEDKLTLELIKEAWKLLQTDKLVMKVFSFSESIRLVLMAVLFNELYGKRKQTSTDIHYKQNEFRQLLERELIELPTTRNLILELVTAGFLHQERKGRGFKRGVENYYSLAISSKILSEAFMRDPTLSVVYEKELAELSEWRRMKAREKLGLR